MRMIPTDSQYPLGLELVAGIKSDGTANPAFASIPVSADVPLRCMPRMKTR